jgi:TatD DNase family protein
LDAPVFAVDLEQVLTRAREAGVERVLAVGSSLASSKQALSIAQQHSSVHAALGVHPHEAHRFQQEAKEVEALLGGDKVVAVGEIGLDYYRGGASREEQLDAFREQVCWACERHLPVSVHNRSADGDVMEVLAGIPVTAVLHCFTGDWTLASAALAAGHFLSFAGNLTYPKAGLLRQVAAQVPLDHVLLETDAPVLAPQSVRGRRNEPAHLIETLSTFASIRGLSCEQAADQLCRNAERVFGWGAA